MGNHSNKLELKWETTRSKAELKWETTQTNLETNEKIRTMKKSLKAAKYLEGIEEF